MISIVDYISNMDSRTLVFGVIGIAIILVAIKLAKKTIKAVLILLGILSVVAGNGVCLDSTLGNIVEDKVSEGYQTYVDGVKTDLSSIDIGDYRIKIDYDNRKIELTTK